MNSFLTILFMVLVGAVIGASTNYLAIKMLFHPFKAYFLFGKRLPFTPGLLPKRRDELASQLGKLVVEHLLTPESIHKKLNDGAIKQDMSEWVQGEVKKILNTEKSLEEVFSRFGLQDSTITVEKYIQQFVLNKYEGWIAEYRSRPLYEILPFEIEEKVTAKIPEASAFIIQKGIEYFSSSEGKERLDKMIDDFFKNRGKLINLIQMFIGNGKIVDKVQPELLKFLEQSNSVEMLTVLITKEWEKVKDWDGSRVEVLLGETDIKKVISEKTADIIAVPKFMKRPITEMTGDLEGIISDKVIPAVLDEAFLYINDHIQLLIEKMQIEKIVEEQVASFPMERLEELVLSIAKKELSMITYLGALLGGIIGIFQGLIAIFMP